MCAMNTMIVFLATKRTTAGAGTERTARTVRSVHTRYSVDTASEVARAHAGGEGAKTKVEPPQDEGPDEQDVQVRANEPGGRVRREIVEHDVHAAGERQVIALERIPDGGKPDHTAEQRRRHAVQIHIEQPAGQH